MPEREVYHTRYGRGVVKQTRHKGFELSITFEDGLTRWVRLDELTGIAPPELPKTSPPPIFSDERLRSRRMIEAFRLGIVPYDSVEDFTFGRDRETKKVMNWLDVSEESTMLLVGTYGTGKTHLLHYASSRALQKGFAIAWVEMDPNEAPFHKPKRLYSHLIQNFKYCSKQSGRLGDFRDFLKEVFAQRALNDHTYFKYLLGKTSDEVFWDWIEARETIVRPWSWHGGWIDPTLPGLYDYSTAANIYCYLLSALGWAAKEVLGLKGLLLIFDEAETVNMYHYPYQAERGRNFLRALLRTANDEAILLDRPRGSGLRYCRVQMGQRVPFLYKIPSGLKLLFAFTSMEWSYRGRHYIPEIENAPKIRLEPLSDKSLKAVFEHICLLYDSAYDFLEEDLAINAIFEHVTTQGGRTRLFVKGSVEALDLVRLNHGETLDEVLK